MKGFEGTAMIIGLGIASLLVTAAPAWANDETKQGIGSTPSGSSSTQSQSGSTSVMTESEKETGEEGTGAKGSGTDGTSTGARPGEATGGTSNQPTGSLSGTSTGKESGASAREGGSPDTTGRKHRQRQTSTIGAWVGALVPVVFRQ